MSEGQLALDLLRRIAEALERAHLHSLEVSRGRDNMAVFVAADKLREELCGIPTPTSAKEKK